MHVQVQEEDEEKDKEQEDEKRGDGVSPSMKPSLLSAFPVVY